MYNIVDIKAFPKTRLVLHELRTLQFLTWSESRWVGILYHIELCDKYLFCGQMVTVTHTMWISLSAYAYPGLNLSRPMIGT